MRNRFCGYLIIRIFLVDNGIEISVGVTKRAAAVKMGRFTAKGAKNAKEERSFPT